MFLGLRSHILDTDDLQATKAWYSDVLGKPPYFDESFYVGFDVGGFELGLLPRDADKPYPAGGETYWGVADIRQAVENCKARAASLSMTSKMSARASSWRSSRIPPATESASSRTLVQSREFGLRPLR